jgi:hypothetical protein
MIKNYKRRNGREAFANTRLTSIQTMTSPSQLHGRASRHPATSGRCSRSAVRSGGGALYIASGGVSAQPLSHIWTARRNLPHIRFTGLAVTQRLKIRHTLHNWKSHYRLHNSPPLDLTLGQINPIHTPFSTCTRSTLMLSLCSLWTHRHSVGRISNYRDSSC